MRKMLCLVLLLPLVAMAGQLAAPVRGLPPISGEEAGIVNHPARILSGPGKILPTDVIVGRLDTVGGSTYDMEFNGPPEQTIYFDPGYGIHVTFISSTDLGGTYPDRNMRYNFFDKSLTPPAWAYNQGSDFMNWGVATFGERTGFGNLDVNTATHCEYISGHYTNGSVTSLTMAQDQAPGSGSFIECADPTNNQLWPAMMLDSFGTPQIASIQDNGSSSRTNLYYENVNPWCTYSTPLAIAPPDSTAGGPDVNLACSKVSNTVVLTWVGEDLTGAHPWYGFYKKSVDDGATWEDAVQLPLPDIYNLADTVSSCEQTSLVPWFDWNDSLHIAMMVMPMFGSPLTYISLNRSSLWDWTSQYGLRLVHSANTENLMGTGGNRWFAYADRLVICQTGPTELVAVWNQNDSMNIDSVTGMCRADILGRRSGDGGATWGDWVGLRTGGTTSRRYVDIASVPDGDSCDIIYLEDLQAGTSISPSPDGAITDNPMIHQRFWKNVLPLPNAVAEGKPLAIPRLALGDAVPNPTRGATSIAYALPKTGNVSLRIYDEAGRPVRTLVNTHANPGRYSAAWNGRGDNGAPLASGVYFYTLASGTENLTKKLTVLR